MTTNVKSGILHAPSKIGGVLFVVNSLTRGGSEHKAVQLANGLVAQGLHAVVAYMRDVHAMRDLLSERVAAVPLSRAGHFSPRVIRKLLQIVDGKSVDIIVAVNPYPTLYAVLLKALRPHLRVISSINTSTVLSARERRRLAVYRWALRRCDFVIFGAAEQRRLWNEEHRCALKPQRTAILYNGVDTARFDPASVAPARPPHWPAERKIIGIVAALRPEKAHLQLVEALSRIRQHGVDAGLIVVGDGPCRAEIEDRVRVAGLMPQVIMVGDVSDVRPYLAAFHIFALPSIAVETFSNAALESMAMGCPVIASSIGGMPEMLRFGGGMLFPSGDIESLTAGLLGVLTSEDKRRKLCEQSRQVVLAHFSKERMVADFAAMLESSQRK